MNVSCGRVLVGWELVLMCIAGGGVSEVVGCSVVLGDLPSIRGCWRSCYGRSLSKVHVGYGLISPSWENDHYP